MGQAILVTGTTGNVGQYVVKYLETRGEKVVVAGSRLDELIRRFSAVRRVRLDFENLDTFEAALDGIDRVFMMRPPQIGDAEVFQSFVDAMAKRSLRLVAFLSVMGVERNSFPPHYKIEKMIETARLPYVHIRPGFFMPKRFGTMTASLSRLVIVKSVLSTPKISAKQLRMSYQSQRCIKIRLIHSLAPSRSTMLTSRTC